MARPLTMRLGAIILVGGRSSRFGRDKSLLDVGGASALLRVVGAVQPLVDEVLLVGGSPRFEATGLRWVADDVTEGGPLGGLVSGLRALEADACFALACDTPLLSTSLLACLRDVWAAQRDVQVVVPRLSAGLEPLVAIYGRAARSALEEALKRGERALHRVLARMRVCEVSESTLREVDPELDGFLNINTPADLERVLACIALRPI